MPRVFAPEGSPSPGTDTCEAGKRWEWDGVMFEFLHPNAGFPYLGNEASCVLRVKTRHGSALLPGDAGHYVERKLLNEAPAALRSDVVVVGHHGSLGSSSAEFVTAVGARLALVSSGADNRFKHPRPQVVQRWCASGAEVVDTQRLQLREQRVFQTRLWDAIRRLGRASGLCYAPEISRP
jgi:competence protein ComEC